MIKSRRKWPKCLPNTRRNNLRDGDLPELQQDVSNTLCSSRDIDPYPGGLALVARWMTVGGPTTSWGSWGSNEQRGINLATWLNGLLSGRTHAPGPVLSPPLSLAGDTLHSNICVCWYREEGASGRLSADNDREHRRAPSDSSVRIPKSRDRPRGARLARYPTFSRRGAPRGGPNYGFSAGTVKPSGHVELVK